MQPQTPSISTNRKNCVWNASGEISQTLNYSNLEFQILDQRFKKII